MLRRSWPIALLVSIAVAASLADHCGLFGTLGPDRHRYHCATATITNVVDGDTFDLDLPDSSAETTRVRLLGIDCPELGHGDSEKEAPFGREAAAFARNQFRGKRVKIMLDPTRPVRDKHGRLLAYLFVADGSDSWNDASINQIMIDRGLAYADWRFEHVHELRFERAERLAMRGKVGLWSKVARDQMPQWRQEMMKRGERR